MNISNKVDKGIEAKLKLRVLPHVRRTHSCSAYMIANAYGYIVGGNLRVYIPKDQMRNYDYPTVFRHREAIDFLNSRDVKSIFEEDVVYDYGFRNQNERSDY